MYCEDVEVAGVRHDAAAAGPLEPTSGAYGVLASAIDRDNAPRLWKLSEELLDRE